MIWAWKVFLVYISKLYNADGKELDLRGMTLATPGLISGYSSDGKDKSVLSRYYKSDGDTFPTDVDFSAVNRAELVFGNPVETNYPDYTGNEGCCEESVYKTYALMIGAASIIKTLQDVDNPSELRKN